MVGFGLGFGSHSMSRQYAALGQNVPVSTLSPSSAWTGLAGSGFAGSPPIDPLRTTAKPVCRLLTPPNQYFTDELVIGVWAGANNLGSMLDNMGIAHVIAHCEGESLEIAAPSFYVFTDANGILQRLFGWWVVLKHSGTHGHVQVYFEAVPKDTSMQRRVIGPYQFSPQASLHDYQIEVAATPPQISGQRYKTLMAAFDYLASVSAQNPLITFIETANYDITPSIIWRGAAGYTTITATVPITFKKPGFSIGFSRFFYPRVLGLWFRGPNITFDFAHASYIYHEDTAARDFVFEGVRFTDSNGSYYPYLKGPKGTINIANNGAWYLECDIENIEDACLYAELVRNCALRKINRDAASLAKAVIGSSFENCGSDEWRNELPALTVRYTGGGASATIELSGGNEENARVFNAKVAGTSVGTFTLRNTEADFTANTHYTVQNLVSWINTLPGWTATLLDDSRRATSLSKSGTIYAPIPTTDVKTATLTLYTAFDQHSDLWALDAGSNENVVFANNRAWKCSAPGVYVGPPAGLIDAIIINNVFDQDETSPDFGALLSQLTYAQSHVVVAHNSWSNQQLILSKEFGFNPDAYCLIAANVLPGVAWTGAPGDADLAMANNHLFAGASTPVGATGTTTGGTKNSLFLDAANGNFQAQGQLLAVLKQPVVRHDMVGTARPVPALLGALAGSEALAPAITSSNPSGSYLENLPIGSTLTANKTVTWSVTGPDAGAIMINPASGAWSLAATDFESKTSYAFVFVATDSVADFAEQTVAINIADVDELAPILSGAQGTANGTSGASLSVVTNEGNGTIYWYVSTSAVAPPVATLIAGTGAVAGGSQVITVAGTFAASVSGLSAATTYFTYFLHRDGAGNTSAIAAGSGFTTDAGAGGNASVVNSAVVLKTTDFLPTYAATPFPYVGGTGRALVAVIAMAQQAAQLITDLTASVDGIAMTRIAGAAHAGGASRPICAVFVATGLAAGSKTITVQVNGNARSCTVMAMEVAGLNTASILANAIALEGSTLTYSHSYTPTMAGNFVVSALVTRQGDRGPFTPDAGMIELQDDSTGTTATNDHSVFAGYALPTSTSAINVGASTVNSADCLFVVAELRKV